MASQGYYDWIDAGRPYTLAAPLAALRDLLRGYGYTVYDIGNEAHQLAVPPEDHMPYSETGWPVASPRWYGFAIDVMPPAGTRGLPSLGQLGAQIVADKNAGVPGTEWLKYINWEPGDGNCWHDKWQPSYVRSGSKDRGHIHLSGRSDHVTVNTLGSYDPVARARGADMAFVDACKKGDKGPAVQWLQYALYDCWAASYPAEPPLYPGNPESPTLPATFDTATGNALKRMFGGDGVNFTPLLAKRLLRRLGSLDGQPAQLPQPDPNVLHDGDKVVITRVSS